MSSKTAYKTTLGAGFLAALGATVCCFGPLLLVTLGFGGAWIGTLRSLEAYQPLFAIVTAVSIGIAFYRIYIHPRRCQPNDNCAMPGALRRQRIAFWFVVIAVALMYAFPLFAPFFY